MIETKEVAFSSNINLNDLAAFGWQKTQEVTRRSGRSSYSVNIIARETTMPHYNELRKLELDYNEARGHLKTYNPIEPKIALVALAWFIIPGVIYITFKKIQKSRINSNNEIYLKQMSKLVAEARNIK